MFPLWYHWVILSEVRSRDRVLSSQSIIPIRKTDAMQRLDPTGFSLCLEYRSDYIPLLAHYGDVIMGTMASQITSLAIVFNRLFGSRSKKTSKLRVTGLCVGNPPGTGEFPAQMASNAANVSIWWRHHELSFLYALIWFHCQLVVDNYGIDTHIIWCYSVVLTQKEY